MSTFSKALPLASSSSTNTKSKARGTSPTPAMPRPGHQLPPPPSPSTISNSTNHVRIPKAVANYSDQTLDYDLRSQINLQLLDTGHVHRIQSSLLDTLQQHPSDWTARIQAHALHLLRTGECTTFPTLIARVLADIKADNRKARAMGEYRENRAPLAKGAVVADIGLAIPQAVVEEGLKITRESLEAVCEVVGGND